MTENPERRFASELVSGYCALLGLEAPAAENALVNPLLQENVGKAMILAPHPDDEVVVGALPLRLKREAGLEIVAVPVTFGSKQERQAARKLEMQAACAVLGFRYAEIASQPLHSVRPEIATEQPIIWQGMSQKLANLLLAEKPQFLFLPHRHDGHPTHIGVHRLAMNALAKLPQDFAVTLIFTEFWQPQADPNLMVGIAPADLELLVTALMAHSGEIARNPYHRRLPAFMIDSARRGEEIIGGFGVKGAITAFASLYQIGRWHDGMYQSAAQARVIGLDAPVSLS
jgi:N-acetylglucosamine malate deacetylase 1